MDAESLRKAAILINALDARTADALLEQMSEAQSDAVRRAVMELDDVDPDEQEAVIQAFLSSQPGREAAPVAPSAAPPKPPTQAAAIEQNSPLFGFLHTIDPSAVHSVLAGEHPQTVAIVLAHLPPKQASSVLRLLADETQTSVLRRIARLGAADVEVLRDIEDEMRRVFSTHAFQSDPTRGVSSLQAILAATDGQEREDWMKDIERFDPTIAERLHEAEQAPATGWRFPRMLSNATAETPQVGPSTPSSDIPVSTPAAVDDADDQPRVAPEAAIEPPAPLEKLDADSDPPSPDDPLIAFDDLYKLDDQALAHILKRSPRQVALVALAGADRTFVERLLRQLPANTAQSLNQQMEQVGPLRLKDVELAQRSLARMAEKLAHDGVIQLPAAHRFAAAA